MRIARAGLGRAVRVALRPWLTDGAKRNRAPALLSGFAADAHGRMHCTAWQSPHKTREAQPRHTACERCAVLGLKEARGALGSPLIAYAMAAQRPTPLRPCVPLQSPSPPQFTRRGSITGCHPRTPRTCKRTRTCAMAEADLGTRHVTT